MSKTKITLNYSQIHTILLIALLVILVIGSYSIFNFKKEVGKPPEPPDLAELKLTIITPPDCEDCFDEAAFAEVVKQTPQSEVEEEYVRHDSIEGQKYIKEYDINRLPAAVVTGEIDDVTVQGFTKEEDAYVFKETPPPYYDVKEAGVKGRVEMIMITDSSCTECFDIALFQGQLQQLGVALTKTETIDFTKASELINKYSITKVPTMLLSEDALAYDILAQVWPQVGTQEEDGMLVMRNVSPPYRDIASRKIRGLVTITYLVDPECPDCYNATQHKLVLEQSMGMVFKEEKTLDITKPLGKQMIEKYGLTKVPAFLLDEEAAAYPSLPPAWEQVGFQADDGTFVFEKVDLLDGVKYKDLETGEIKDGGQ